MSTVTSIIDTIATPPLASLQQVLDTGGPYAAGDHTLATFATGGAFLLPAGTYGVGGTYGVIVQASTIPSVAGLTFGWNDAAYPTISGDVYEDRIAQLCLLYTLPISGATVIGQTFDVSLASQLMLWPAYIGGGTKIGLHVAPGFAVELFYMCVL